MINEHHQPYKIQFSRNSIPMLLVKSLPETQPFAFEKYNRLFPIIILVEYRYLSLKGISSLTGRFNWKQTKERRYNEDEFNHSRCFGM